MQCPTDGSTLVMSERSGVEIDYCPQCRGVWLDRGELDKIVERSEVESTRQSADFSSDRTSRDGHGSSGRGSSHDAYSNGRGRKKENWLGDLFG
ncbi:hypothetical protein FQ154_10620 [Paeniglutamicibacter gangotriensis]|uniref:Transcription factor zinc-finger domain-containing protein n=2 Tax=Paeniglutamicibacter gangotriensis TaxID=254787 RepID=A0A5B0EFM0_9MICC|nr:zf-TFIIB domain-containing protein [Paeniglutamicibacter gangotriensis]KAA0976611.1 hypothetical protein FQ154_10620 [Paeniglutamicibacter gangotriensis]